MSVDTTPITRFLDRVRQAAKSDAKDLRVPIGEATEIAATLAQILAAQLSTTAGQQGPTTVTMDGGTFLL